MARYDDWVYERGLENESWVHDRWGDDDYDDDFEEDLDEGEDDMEKNRISFVREYSELEKLALKTKVHRILVELKEMGVGPSAFKLSEEVVAIYNFNKSKIGTLSFKMKDSESYDDFNYDYYTGEYSNLALFLSKWDELKVELLAAKDAFDKKVQDITNITYTKEDGVYIVCKALEQGANIDISTIFDVDSLTFKDKETFIKFGYGYDLYKEDYENHDEWELNNLIMEQLKRYHLDGFTMRQQLNEKLNEALDKWIEEHPDKCLLPKNRK